MRPCGQLVGPAVSKREGREGEASWARPAVQLGSVVGVWEKAWSAFGFLGFLTVLYCFLVSTTHIHTPKVRSLVFFIWQSAGPTHIFSAACRANTYVEYQHYTADNMVIPGSPRHGSICQFFFVHVFVIFLF